MERAKPTILVVDDHESVCLGVSAALSMVDEWEVCGNVGSGLKAIECAAQFRPNVVVQDLVLPQLDGIEVLRQIKRVSPETEVIIFTGHLAESLVHQAVDAGACSFIVKTDPTSELLKAVRAAMTQKPYFTQRVAELLFARFQQSSAKPEELTPEGILTFREREAIQLIAEGNSNKELARKMGVSLRTAESHRASIKQKLKLGSIGELIRYAIRNGIIQP